MKPATGSAARRRPPSSPKWYSWLVGLLPPLLVGLCISAGFFTDSGSLQLLLLALSTAVMLSLILHLYRILGNSAHSGELDSARIHLLAHLVPLMFFLVYMSAAQTWWIVLGLVALLVAFFTSGKIAWRTLAGLFPSTLLYKIFERGNAAFIMSFPLLYLASLLFPNIVTFSTIKGVALFYFSIHFMMLGVASLKIQSDLQAPETTT